MSAPIDIAFCFDDHLGLAGATAILSLLRSQAGAVRVHVLADAGTRVGPMLRAMGERHGAEIRIYDASSDAGYGFDPTSDYGRPSLATYRRLLLGEFLRDLDRVIYLDADMIVRRDLAALWATDLGDAPLGAVPDTWMATIGSMQAQYPLGYFNAGMLLLDLGRWRAEDLTGQCLDEIARCQREAATNGTDVLVYRYEQTPMNTVLHGRWRAMPPKWNYTAYLTPRLAAELGLSPADYEEAVRDPAVVHFLGSHKPWQPGFERLGPWHREFQELRDELDTAYGNAGLDWPTFNWNGPQASRRRRLMALGLVARAKATGFEAPVIVLTGLLGLDVLAVAQEQNMPVAGFASESPAHAEGSLFGVEVMPVAEAIDRGHRDFILGDYRRVGRTRSWVEEEAQARDARLRILDVAGLSPAPT